MAEKKRKKRKHFSKLMQKKLVGSFALVLFVLLGLNLRIVYITAKNGDNYAKQVLSQKQYDSRTIPYKRGEIQDRNGNVFAKSEKVYNVILDCVAVNGGDEEEQAKLKEQEIDYIEPTIDALVKTLGLDEAELRSLITDPATSGSRYQVLKKGISLEEKQTFEDYTEIDSEKEYTKTDLARRRCVQGVWFEEDYVRDYPLKTLASNVIGVGSNSGGASGLESYYTDVLSGTDGREFGYLDENSDLQRTIVEPMEIQSFPPWISTSSRLWKSTSLNLMPSTAKMPRTAKVRKTSVSSSEIRRTARFMRWRATTDLTSRIRTI